MFRDIIAILKKYDITMSDLQTVLTDILTNGLPPSIEAKTELRKWLLDTIPVLDQIAVRTSTPWDDRALEFWSQVLSIDEQWDLVYDLLVAVYERVQTDARVLAIAPGEKVKVQAISQQVGMDIDWNQIMEAIKLIVDLIELLKDAK